MTTVLAQLAACVGHKHVRHEGDLGTWERDWSGRYQGRALAVVLPSSAIQVAEVLQICAVAGLTIVPQGGNTGMVGGGVPDDTGRQVILNTRRLDRIRTLDAANLTLTAEAGCILQTIQSHALAHGRCHKFFERNRHNTCIKVRHYLFIGYSNSFCSDYRGHCLGFRGVCQ